MPTGRVTIGCFLIGIACVGCDPPNESTTAPGEAASGSALEKPAPDASPLFKDITDQSRITFRHQAGGATYFVPRSIGSGGALLDFDNDGRLDIYLIQNAGPGSGVKNQLYRQLGDATFQNVSDGSGLDIDGYGMGVAVGDVNNDGRLDVLVTEIRHGNRLWRYRRRRHPRPFRNPPRLRNSHDVAQAFERYLH